MGNLKALVVEREEWQTAQPQSGRVVGMLDITCLFALLPICLGIGPADD